jgi:N-acetylmuramoyl-L-alanine amidase
LPNFVVGSSASSWAGENTSAGTSNGLPSAGTSNGLPSDIIAGPTTYTFAPIASMEELEAELRSASREITETIVHWTAHYIDNAGVGAREIHQIGIARGFSGCSYHYIIKRDGTIERGRPINIKGAHAKANGHNNFSIGISFVAGYNCLSGTPNYERYVSSESISSQQWTSLDQYLECFYKVFPGGQVFGHNDTDPGRKPDPGVDIPQYVENKFGKSNVNGGTTFPLSPTLLAQARGTSSTTATT